MNELVPGKFKRLALNGAGRLKRSVSSLANRYRGADRPDDATFVENAYNFILGREADAAGRLRFIDHLQQGRSDRSGVLTEMRGSDEFWFNQALRNAEPLIALHRSRCLFAQQLPRAGQILDLGGTHQSSEQGALISLGYPYRWDRLVIVDLPPDERHDLYKHMKNGEPVATRLGPVEYSFHSMADLSPFEDNTFDLVYSGQTFEHVPEDVGDTVLAEAFRVLKPGGHLALDTPNGAACRLQLVGTGETVINPDHDIEYDHTTLSNKLIDAGFGIVRELGLTRLPQTFTDGEFHVEELQSIGVFSDIEHCYFLAYLCEKPLTS